MNWYRHTCMLLITLCNNIHTLLSLSATALGFVLVGLFYFVKLVAYILRKATRQWSQGETAWRLTSLVYHTLSMKYRFQVDLHLANADDWCSSYTVIRKYHFLHTQDTLTEKLQRTLHALKLFLFSHFTEWRRFDYASGCVFGSISPGRRTVEKSLTKHLYWTKELLTVVLYMWVVSAVYIFI